MSNNTTVMINSLDALERIIGKDSKLEMDIRTNIVNKFCEKHLKPLVKNINSEILKRGLDTQIKQYFNIDYWNQYTAKGYTQNMEKVIKDYSAQVFDKKIREIVKECYDAQFAVVEKNIKAQIEQKLNGINVNTIVQEQVAKILAQKFR